MSGLVVRGVYRLRARNLSFGVWTGSAWVGLREKLGGVFLDESEVPGVTAFPLELVAVAPDDLVLRAYLGSECMQCQRPVDFDASRGETWQERWQHTEGPADHDARSQVMRNPALFDYMTAIERGVRP